MKPAPYTIIRDFDNKLVACDPFEKWETFALCVKEAAYHSSGNEDLGTALFDHLQAKAIGMRFNIDKTQALFAKEIEEARKRDGVSGNSVLRGADTWKPGLELVCMNDIKARPINWLWGNMIALGKVTFLAGDGGLGKSTVLFDLAARLTAGANWPDGSRNEYVGNVIILASEDAADDTIKPRLAAAGADMSKVFIISAVNGETKDERRSFNLQMDLEALTVAIDRVGDVRLVIIDPITSYLGKVDSHKNAEIRGAVLEPLSRFAERAGCAVLANNHLNKGSGPANQRIIGSVAFVNAARSGFIVTADADDDTRRLFIPSKTNIGPMQQGLAFRVGSYLAMVDGQEISTAQICWDGAVSVSADAALAALLDDDDAKSKLDEARSFLEAELAEGPVLMTELKKAADGQGIAWATVRRAKKGLIQSKKDGFGKEGVWIWSLISGDANAFQPKMLISTKDDHSSDVSTFGNGEHLKASPPPEDDDLSIPPFLRREPKGAVA